MGAAESSKFHRVYGFSSGPSDQNPAFQVDRLGGITCLNANLTGGLNVAGNSALTGTLAVTGAITSASTVTYSGIGLGPVLKQGANGLVGTFVANGATPVTVSNTNVAISDAIIISLNTVGGTVGVQPHVATITAATGFTVVCTASDTSTYNYTMIKNAA